PADRVVGADIGHGQAFNIITASREHACDSRQYTGLVIDQNGEDVPFNPFFVDMHQTSAFALPAREPLMSSSDNSSSACAGPDGVIGTPLASCATRQSAGT